MIIDQKKSNSTEYDIAPSIISSDLRIDGGLFSTGDIHIEGVVYGDIRSKRITVGEGCKIQGSLFAEEITISGSIKGEISARSVTLTKTAEVDGNINHISLSIEAGAFIQGLCKRVQDESEVLSEIRNTPELEVVS